MKQKFYMCKQCGKIIFAQKGELTRPKCCGHKMSKYFTKTNNKKETTCSTPNTCRRFYNNEYGELGGCCATEDW